MASINSSDNSFVAYNYQKVPNLTTSNYEQSIAGLTVSMRDRTNTNRNPIFLFPANLTTPNFGAGSVTIGARTLNPILPDGLRFAGRQISL